FLCGPLQSLCASAFEKRTFGTPSEMNPNVAIAGQLPCAAGTGGSRIGLARSNEVILRGESRGRVSSALDELSKSRVILRGITRGRDFWRGMNLREIGARFACNATGGTPVSHDSRDGCLP